MDKMCMICTAKDGKYVCPRCNVLYCSVDCYRAERHSLCSEAFYKEWIAEELKSERPDDEGAQKKKMLEILHRLKEEEDIVGNLDSDDDDSEGEVIDIAERLKDIDLDDADSVWSRLTEEERKQFEDLVKSGNVDSIVPTFEPWWNYKDERKVVELDEKHSSDLEVFKTWCPKIVNSVLPFSAISKTKPSDTVCFNVANILAAYSVIVHYYAGDHKRLASEAAQLLMKLSTNLSSNQNFPTLELALKSVTYEIQNCQWLLSDAQAVGSEVDADVAKIFAGPNFQNKTYYVEAALADLHSLIRAAKGSCNLSKDDDCNEQMGEFSKRFQDHPSTSSSIPKSKLKLSLKKIEYYQSWVKYHFISPF